MKNLTFLLGAVALLTASCSNDEVIDVTQPQGISFETFVNKSTRASVASDITLDNLKKNGGFSVWAVTWSPVAKTTPSSLFLGTNVYYDESKGWTYAPLKFWAKGDNYRFSALAPYINQESNPGVLTVEQNLTEITDMTNVKGGLKITFDNKTAGANTDLCYAFKTIENASSTQDAVELEFSHMLSRVKFTFRNAFPSILSAIQITDLKISDATAKATIDKYNGEALWTDANGGTFPINFTMQDRTDVMGEQAKYILGGYKENTGGVDPKSVSYQMESDHFYIFPLNGAKKYTVKFTVSLYNYDPTDGTPTFALVDSYEHSVELPEIAYQPNYSYNFIATINPDNIDPAGKLYPIEFNPTVNPWNDFTDETVTIPVGPSTETPSNP